MNKKRIKEALERKHKEFVASIKDEHTRNLVDKNSIISGGCIASMLLRDKVKDYDYYFTNFETAKAVAEYYVKEFNESNSSSIAMVDTKTEGRVRIHIESDGVAEEDGIVVDPEENLSEADEIDSREIDKGGKEKYRPIYLSDNAITLSDKVQAVIRFYGDADKIHENFDYIHCTNYWKSEGSELVLKLGALESVLSKQLQYVGSLYPVSSIVRMRKFINRGWTINAGQILKILMQISELDLTDVSVLEEQLTGVDTTYFTMLIVSLKKKHESDPEFKVSQPYVASIVDKIFG